MNEEASAKDMKLNAKKTTIICISAAHSFEPKSYIKLNDDVIISGKSLKLLGFHFNTTLSVGAHVATILRKIHYRTWFIHNLKRLGLGALELINIYKTLIHPCFDYACVVYHSLL